MTLHFYDFYHATGGDQLKIGSFLFSPIVFGLLTLIFRNKSDVLVRITQLLFPIILIGWIIVNLLYYSLFYQIFGGGNLITAGFNEPPVLIGMMGSLTDPVQILFEINLMYTYVIMVPVIMILLTQGGKIIPLSEMTVIASGVFSFYMLFRIGGFAGVPLRAGISGLIACIFWMLPLSESEKDELINQKYPSRIILPVFLLLSFIWGTPSYTSTGLLDENWVWIGGFVGSILWSIMNPKINPENRKKLGKIAFIGLSFVFILIIGSNLNFTFRMIRPISIMLGLLLSYGILGIDFMDGNQTQNSLKNWGGFIFLFSYTNLMIIMPFIAGTSNPITDILAIILFALSGMFLIKRRKKLIEKSN
jgi:hypothetical protein